VAPGTLSAGRGCLELWESRAFLCNFFDESSLKLDGRYENAIRCEPDLAEIAQKRGAGDMRRHDSLIDELKLVLRESRITYADVAEGLGLSESSVKRMFATGRFTLQRFEEACHVAGVAIADLVERIAARKSMITELTVEQEEELMADPKLFLMTYLTFNRWSIDEILRVYSFTQPDVDRLLTRLDQLGVIELRPGRRIRYLLTRNFSWRKNGPMQRFLERRILPEFFQSRFDEANSEFRFFAAALSPASAAQLQRSIMRLLREFNELAEQDTTLPMDQRQGTAGVLALRPMHFTGFARFKRDEASAVDGSG
jgi:AraC-like DNA-binding protein